MDFKQLAHSIKEMDDSEGIVIAYANVYNFEDSDGDISAPGSFTKTVSEQSKRIRVLKDHNSTISLGVPLKMDANDSYGLLTTTKFNLKKQVSQDMFSDIKLYKENGLNAELSIGYEVMRRDKSNRKIIQEYKLYEYSFLTSWAANELSIVEGIKSVKTVEGIKELLVKAYDLKYSDPRLKEIETLLQSLTKTPDEISTSENEPIDVIKYLTSKSKFLKDGNQRTA